MTYQSFIKSEFSELDLAEVLNSHPSVLLGVSPAIETALQRLDVVSVFDLGMSTIFDNAARVLAASENPRSTMRRYGRAPTSMIKTDDPELQAAELPYESLSLLKGVSQTTAQILTDLLSI